MRVLLSLVCIFFSTLSYASNENPPFNLDLLKDKTITRNFVANGICKEHIRKISVGLGYHSSLGVNPIEERERCFIMYASLNFPILVHESDGKISFERPTRTAYVSLSYHLRIIDNQYSVTIDDLSVDNLPFYQDGRRQDNNIYELLAHKLNICKTFSRYIEVKDSKRAKEDYAKLCNDLSYPVALQLARLDEALKKYPAAQSKLIDSRFYETKPGLTSIERTINATNYSYISGASGNIFFARYSTTDIYHIFNLKGEKMGEIELNSPWTPSFHGEDVATAIVKGKGPCIIKKDGAVLKSFPKASDISQEFVNDLAFIKIGNTSSCINMKGETIKHNIQNIEFMSKPRPLVNGLRAFQEHSSGLWGYMDKDCNVVIKAQFKEVHDFSENYAVVEKNDVTGCHWIFIDSTGKQSINTEFTIEPTDFHDGFAIIRDRKNKCYFMNTAGIMRNQGYDLCSSFVDGIAIVNDPQWGICSVNKDFKIVRAADPNSIYGKPIGNNLYYSGIFNNILYNNEGLRKVDMSEYHFLQPFNPDVALVEKGDVKGFINTEGKLILRFVVNRF